MKKFPFLKCCEWLYYGALSAGILFVLLGFLQGELAEAGMFAETSVEGLLGFLAVGVFGIQLLFVWSSEKGYRFQTGLALLVINAAAGLVVMRQPEKRIVFWYYVGMEAVCIVSAAAVYVIRHFLVLKGVLILSQAVSLVTLAVLEKSLPGWCVGIMLTAFLLFLVELASRERKEMLGLLPVFMAALFLLCCLPRAEEPLDWSWVGKAYHAVQEKAETLLVDISYLLGGEGKDSFAGYGNEGKLGGSVLDNEREQLLVAGSGTKNPLYLTGAVYGEYTGREWKAVPEQENNAKREQEDILYALGQSIYDGQQERLTFSSLIAVEYRFIRTVSFFHDLYATDLYFPEEVPRLKKDGSWTMEKARGKEFAYQMRFLEINEKSEEIKSLFRQQAWKEDAVWEEAFLQQEAEIYQTYTKLPDEVPQRVYELAHSIATEADNDYDRMTAFADYLKEYNYSTTPPECPDGREFTDYFLFDSKSGYCTSFATALAVLGRCEGIPTRYVTGFMTAKPCKNTRTNVLLTGNQGHAWVEVYIEHVGWVRFDATPGYGDVQTDRWKSVEMAGTGQMEKAGSYEEEKPQGMLSEEEILQESGAALQGRTMQGYVVALLEFVFVLLAGSILVAAVFVYCRNILHRRKYAHMDMQEKMRQQLEYLLRLGKLRGMPMQEGETLYAYQERTKEIWDAKEHSFSEICDLYESMRFGERNVSAEELRILEEYVREAEQRYLTECGFLRRLVYRCFS